MTQLPLQQGPAGDDNTLNTLDSALNGTFNSTLDSTLDSTLNSTLNSALNDRSGKGRGWRMD